MRRLLVIGVLGLVACDGDGSPSSFEVSTAALNAHASSARVCPGPEDPGSARCHAWVGLDAHGNPQVTATYQNGYSPASLQSAYALPSASAGAGVTVAIVDAYDYPKAETDLGVYRAQFGLPPCTTANGCFKKVNQNGMQGAYPRGNSGWALEMALDLDMVSAACPNCKIILVEAKTNSLANLGTAVNTAVKLGANVISNSYGAGEYLSEANDEVAYFQHPGVAITVSSGDAGYGAEFPAASRYVTAVGGTTLRLGSDGTWGETTWSGSGSGCSAYISKPSWQTDPGCARRTVADVSAVADPNTGVAVYDSYTYQGKAGWFVVGGTSAAAPLVGAIYALAGNASSLTYGSYSYSHTSSLRDVTSGSNGACAGSYLCTAQAGYDGPTGNGTPMGVGAF
jgi:subtilase family serine protease